MSPALQSVLHRLRCAVLMVLGASLAGALAAQPLPLDDESAPLSAEFAYEVTEALHPPPETVAVYAQAMQQALAAEGRDLTQLQFVVLVDRSPLVQALLLFWGRDGLWQLVGAAPVSTGQPGRYEHFATPLGVFDHSLDKRAAKAPVKAASSRCAFPWSHPPRLRTSAGRAR
jgi:hypothetical protein